MQSSNQKVFSFQAVLNETDPMNLQTRDLIWAARSGGGGCMWRRGIGHPISPTGNQFGHRGLDPSPPARSCKERPSHDFFHMYAHPFSNSVGFHRLSKKLAPIRPMRKFYFALCDRPPHFHPTTASVGSQVLWFECPVSPFLSLTPLILHFLASTISGNGVIAIPPLYSNTLLPFICILYPFCTSRVLDAMSPVTHNTPMFKDVPTPPNVVAPPDPLAPPVCLNLTPPKLAPKPV